MRYLFLSLLLLTYQSVSAEECFPGVVKPGWFLNMEPGNINGLLLHVSEIEGCWISTYECRRRPDEEEYTCKVDEPYWVHRDMLQPFSAHKDQPENTRLKK